MRRLTDDYLGVLVIRGIIFFLSLGNESVVRMLTRREFNEVFVETLLPVIEMLSISDLYFSASFGEP